MRHKESPKIQSQPFNFNRKSIEKIENDIEKLEVQKTRLTRAYNLVYTDLKSIRCFTIPYKKHNEYVSYFNPEYKMYYKYFRENVFNEWRDLALGKDIIHPATFNIITIFYYVISVIVLVVSILFTDIRTTLNIDTATYCLLYWALVEIIWLLVDLNTYMFRPNRVNKKILKKDLKHLKLDLTMVETELNAKKDIVKAYEISQINPTKIVGDIEATHTDDLSVYIETARIEVLPKLNEYNQQKFSNILEKCDKLLEMAKENGRIIGEISKIYMIYLTEISTILIRNINNNNETDKALIGLLDNFNTYLDRKIEKYNGINNMLNQVDIDALNKVFTEEDME